MTTKQAQNDSRRVPPAARFLLFFLAFFCLTANLTIPAEAAVLRRDNYWQWVFHTTSSLGNVSGPISRLWLDGREVFCVQVEMENASGDIYPDPIPATQVYAPDVVNRLGLVTLFGFELTGKTDLDAAFTKLYVYETIGYTILGLTDSSGANVFTPAAYQAYKARVNADIEAYLAQVSFHAGTAELVPGRPLELTDTNGVLEGYRVSSAPDGVSADIAGSTLTLSAAPGASAGTVVLQRRTAEQGTSLLYQPPGRQSVIESKIDAPQQSWLTVSVASVGGFRLLKDDGAGQALGGAVFRMTGPDGSSRLLEVPVEGLAVESLPAGDYQLQEVTAPAGYRLSEEARTITVAAGRPAAEHTVSVSNAVQTGSLRVVKLNPEGQPVAGARFEVSRQADMSDPIAVAETDAAGVLLFADLPLAAGTTVYVRELTVPPPYVVDPAIRTATLADGTVTDVHVANERQPWLIELRKTNTAGEPIADVVFELARTEAFESVREIRTGSDGRGVLSGAAAGDEGTWHIREKSVPAPYLLDPRVFTCEVAFGETQALEFVNEAAKGIIRLIKRDTDSGRPLADAVYRFENAADGYRVDVATADDGTIRLTDLPLGSYAISEVAAPAGYVIDPTVHQVELRYQDAATPLVTAEKETVNRQIRGRIRVVKTASDGQERVAGAVFSVTDATGREVAVLSTDADGVAETDALPFGSYTVRETAAPDAYYFDAVTAEAVIESDGQVVQLDLTNEKIALRLHIIKRCDDTGNRLGGAVFEVLNDDGERVRLRHDIQPYRLTTDATGQALAELTLGIGTYRLVEVLPPDGYATMAPLAFEIDRATETVVLESGARLLAADVGNAPTLVEIVKTDERDRPLAGALLQLADETGQTIAVWTSGDAPHRLARLTAGRSYVLSELAPPAGFCLADPVLLAVADTADVQTFRFANRPTALSIDKRDRMTNEPLPGVVFNLRRNGRTLLFSRQPDGRYRIDPAGTPDVVTGADGVAFVMAIPAGTVDVVETAASGYRLDDKPRLVELTNRSDPDSPARLTWFNDPLQVKVLKTDAATGRPLSGAVFAVKDAAGQALLFRGENGVYRPDPNGDTGVRSGDDGTFTLSGLAAGAYVLHETAAPDGFLPADPLAFAISPSERTHLSLTVANRAVSFPATGETDVWPMVGALCVLNGAGIMSIRSLLRKQKRRRRPRR